MDCKPMEERDMVRETAFDVYPRLDIDGDAWRGRKEYTGPGMSGVLRMGGVACRDGDWMEEGASTGLRIHARRIGSDRVTRRE
jgi:hypothetical protein